MSAIQLSPYINFQGKAREAMEFYHTVLGGTLNLQTGDEGRVARAQLDIDGASIVAADGHPKFPATVGDHMALALSGTDKERMTAIFNALAEGGKIKMPLKEQQWGDTIGYVLDQFGMNWTVTIAKA